MSMFESMADVEVQAIQFLGAEYQPTRRQSPAGISQLVKALEPYGLTKAEKLQIVNLAPTQAVELYTVRSCYLAYRANELICGADR